jgi:hypothetical protein
MIDFCDMDGWMELKSSLQSTWVIIYEIFLKCSSSAQQLLFTKAKE